MADEAGRGNRLAESEEAGIQRTMVGADWPALKSLDHRETRVRTDKQH